MGEPKSEAKKPATVMGGPATVITGMGDPAPAPKLTVDERLLEALETLVLTAGEALFHLAALAKAATRLADKFAPSDSGQIIPGGRIGGKRCELGHGMQMSDDYCQTCYRNGRRGIPAARSGEPPPDPEPGPRAA